MRESSIKHTLALLMFNVNMVLKYWYCLLCICSVSEVYGVKPVHFSREILPILSENCFSCHGPDEGHRKADLRLDTREGSLGVIDPKGVSSSELIDRIISNDDVTVMPPPKSRKPRLKPEQMVGNKTLDCLRCTLGKALGLREARAECGSTSQ